jgi:CRISPR system Cascade subunit CasA
VFESLVAGIPSPGDDDGLRGGEADLAPWEAPELPDVRRGPVGGTGIARLLTGRFQHAVLLTADDTGAQVTDAIMTWAWREKCPPATDPYLIYQTSKKGEPYPRPASLTRALWRDLDSLLMKNVGEDAFIRPEVFKAVEVLPLEVVERLRVRVFGFDQDGQTRDKQFFIQTTPPVLRWLEERDGDFAAGISSTRKAAEQAGGNLVYALKSAWAQLADPDDDGVRQFRPGKDPGPWVAAAEGRYWHQAEKIFWRILHDADGNPSPTRFDAARADFIRLAEAVYDDIADQISSREHGRMIRALVRNRYRIRGGLFAAARKKGAA